MSEKEIKRLIGYLKEGGELGRIPNSSVDIIIEALEEKLRRLQGTEEGSFMSVFRTNY